MNPTPLIDGSKLAAQAPGDGVIRPREGVSGPVWLDLDGAPDAVAVARTLTVTRALAPLLSVDESTPLLVGGGPSSRVIASAVAASVPAAQRDQLRLATIRGENVLDRLEEFLRAGIDFVCESSGATLDLQLVPASATCVPPPQVLRDAMEEGAHIVVSAGATRSAYGAALDSEADSPDQMEVSFRVASGAKLAAPVDSTVDAEALASIEKLALHSGVTVRLEKVGDLGLLRIEAASKSSLLDTARRCDLIFGGLPCPLESLVQPVVSTYIGHVPVDRIEFAPDLRSLDEWLDS